MSNEGATAVMETIPSEMAAVVQALASEPNTPPAGADINVTDTQQGEGAVARAMEAMAGEFEEAPPLQSAQPAVASRGPDAGARDDNVAVPLTESVVMPAKERVAEPQEASGRPDTAASAKAQTKTARVKKTLTKNRLKVPRSKKATHSRRPKAIPVKNKMAKTKATERGTVDKVVAKGSKAKTTQARAATKVPSPKPPQKSEELTVPEVWRKIVKKNERQGSKLYDVLVCHHAVLANDNTYRVARACPECRLTVQKYAEGAAAGGGPKVPRSRRP